MVTALRSLGVPVEYERAGPFWALRDGNAMLYAFSKKLEPASAQSLCLGRYVVWRSNHFVAAAVSARGVEVWDDGQASFFDGPCALPRAD